MDTSAPWHLGTSAPIRSGSSLSWLERRSHIPEVTGSSPVPPMRCTVAFLIVIVATAAPCRGQSDSAGLHATLAAWAEDAWLRLLDRDAARDGRVSDQGILQRFNPTIH